MTTRVQGGRTATPNAPPANNSLQPGELYVEMATPLRLWTGVPTSVAAAGTKLVLDTAAQAAANAGAVQKAGDTMTGPLVLSGQPTLAAQAANMSYVDTQSVSTFNTRKGIVTLTAADVTGVGGALLAGPAFTGNPTSTTPAPGDNDTSIATTAFVATAIAAQPGTVIAPTVPAFKAGQLWWDATGGSLYVGYDDGSTQQYVPATNITLPANVATKADVATAQNNVGRNLIHNSAFMIAQRGNGPFTAGTTADRWGISAGTDTISYSVVALPDADRTTIGDEAALLSLQNTFTGNAAAGAYNFLFQRIENLRRLSAKTVLLSFWAKAAAGTPKLGINIAQNFGTGGSPSAQVVALATGNAVTLSTTWTRYTTTIALPSAAGKTFGANPDDNTQLEFWYSSGATLAARSGNIGVQSGTIAIWGVQLEIAQPGQTQPTPLEKRDPVLELQQCQRFFFTGNVIGGGSMNASQTMYVGYGLPVAMRGNVLLALGSNASTNVTGVTFNPTTTRDFYVSAVATAAGVAIINATFTASADL